MGSTKSRTRKITKKGTMSIPQLRTAFDHMEAFTKYILKTKKNKSDCRSAFKKEWLKVFHRSIDNKTIDSYLDFEMKQMKSNKSKTRKHYKGGSHPDLMGAPLDYRTGPGISGSPYGVFPAYVTSGFGISDAKDSLTALPQDITPQIPADMGSNQVQTGGSKKSKKSRKNNQMGGFPSMSEFAQALTFRPLLSSAPTTSYYDGQMAWKGLPAGASSIANTANPPYQAYRPTTLNAVATGIQRDLGNEVRS